MDKKKFHLKKGFTLTEMVVVMAITSILIGITATGVLTHLKNARDAKRVADLNLIADALEKYKANDVNGLYPKFTINGGNTYGWEVVDKLQSEFKILLKAFPKDPKPPTLCSNYLYRSETGTNYTLYTYLENPKSKYATSVKPIPKGIPTSSTFSPNSTQPKSMTVGQQSCDNQEFNYWINSL